MTAVGRILVGVDGSEAACGALRWAARLAVATGGDVVAVTAWEPSQTETPPDVRAELRAAAAARLAEEWSAPARMVGAPTRTRLVEGDVDQLLAIADEEDADLLVVGPRGVGGFAALHLGSVAHHLARHTMRPLAIIPVGARHEPPARIVVGVDGSPGGAAAVSWCAEVAPALGATVTAVSAVDLADRWENEPPATAGAALESAIAAVARQRLMASTGPLRARGLAGERVVLDGVHPVAAIADTATRVDADLLVVGTRGLGGFPGMRLGGVAVQLVHHLHRPVVLVPPRESSEAAGESARTGAVS